jgi:5-hydroxyisourate hydrolase
MVEPMSAITTHVLDITRGLPAQGVRIELERKQGEEWLVLGSGVTDGDGRIRDLLPPESPLRAGLYRLRFQTGEYFSGLGIAALHPFIEIVFDARDESAHYHIPLLVTPHAYSTYRGS